MSPVPCLEDVRAKVPSHDRASSQASSLIGLRDYIEQGLTRTFTSLCNIGSVQ